ncbi:MAG: PD40 domain-containing protein [Phycisphaeraceae bacterium]|nr:PD40 domain-containing protein [Phycisphaeraceae bacterium]
MISIIQSIASPTLMLYWLNLAVVVTIMCAVSLLCAKLIRNCSEVFRHAFIVASLLVLLVTPMAVWVGSHSQLGLLTIKNTHLAETPSLLSPGTPGLARFPWEEFVSHPSSIDQDAVGTEASNSSASESASAPAHLGADIPWRQVGSSLLLMMWCCGTLWLIFRTIRGGMLIRKHLCLSIPATEKLILAATKSAAQRVGLARVPSIFKSGLVPVPFSTGVCYSAVILPEAFLREANRAEMEAVLTHELAHIVRRDHWVGLVQRLTVALFWWNPLVHHASRVCSSLAEEICDDYVADSLKNGEDFARTLVAMAERVVTHLDIPLAIEILPARRHNLERRITRLMQKERKMKTRLSLNHVVLVSLFGLLMTGTTVLSTVWADSRVDVPAGFAETEAVPADPEETTNTLDEASTEQMASVEEPVEKNEETSIPAQVDTLARRIATRPQMTLRLLPESLEVWTFKRLSPDGLRMVYAAGTMDYPARYYQMIIVSDLSTGVERKYDQAGINFPPVWSPDGKRIAFLDRSDIVSSPDSALAYPNPWFGQTVSILTLESGDVEKTDIRGLPCDWSRDGRFLLVIDMKDDWMDDEKYNGIQLVDLKTGEAQTVIRPFQWDMQGLPRLSPDGSYVVYNALGDEDKQHIYVQPIDSDEPIRMTSHANGSWNPLWSADGKHILFMSEGELGRSNLYSMAFQNGKPTGEPEIAVSDMGKNIKLDSCSNSGSLLFSEFRGYSYQVVSTNIDPVSGGILGEPVELTDRKSQAIWPVWSRNGQYIAYYYYEKYEETESEDSRLCIMNSDGSDKRTLGSVKAWTGKGRTIALWHPDNEHILYPGKEAHPENPGETLAGIYSISIRTRERKLIYRDPNFTGTMHLSPDGKHLALTSKSDQMRQLYIIDYDGQNRRQLAESVNGITWPIFTPDGKEIIYTYKTLEESENRFGGGSIMAVSTQGGEPREIFAGERVRFCTPYSSWLPDGRYVFRILGRDQDNQAQYAIKLDGKSEPVQVSDYSGEGYSISPDGTKAVFNPITKVSKLWLMSDFLPNAEAAVK